MYKLLVCGETKEETNSVGDMVLAVRHYQQQKEFGLCVLHTPVQYGMVYSYSHTEMANKTDAELTDLLSTRLVMNDHGALAALEKILVEEHGDWEEAHVRADALLCKLLEDKYPELIKKYKSLTKWYS